MIPIQRARRQSRLWPWALLLGGSWLWGMPSLGAQPFLHIAPTGTPLSLGGEGAVVTSIVKVATVTAATDHPQGLTLQVMSQPLEQGGSGGALEVQVTTVPHGQAAPRDQDFSGDADSYEWITTAPGKWQRDVYVRRQSQLLHSPGQYLGGLQLLVLDN